MLRIAVVNPFDPMPGEPVQVARYATLCRVLAQRGHRVHWYSSDFSHLYKRFRDTASIICSAQKLGYQVTLVPTMPYRRNVSPGRLASHRKLAGTLKNIWRTRGESFDLVLASLPPPSLGLAAARWAKDLSAKIAIDVQDLWPDTFGRFWPAWLRWCNNLAFMAMNRQSHQAYRLADGLIGVANGYIDHAGPFLRPDIPRAMLPLGVDLQAFDADVEPLDRLGMAKPQDQVWLFVSGSLGRYVDVDAIVVLMHELARRDRTRYRLNIVGSGDAEGVIRRHVQAENLSNVHMLGRVSDKLFASLAAASDIALLPIRPDSQVFLPNRIFQYFAAGLSVVSTVGGQIADILSEHQAGATCQPTDAKALADAVERLALHKSADHCEPRLRRSGWVKQFDRWNISNRFADFLEKVAGK